MIVLSELLEIAETSIGQAINETQLLLEEHGHPIAPTTLHSPAHHGTHSLGGVTSPRPMRRGPPAISPSGISRDILSASPARDAST
jgi:hypothetical protein